MEFNLMNKIFYRPHREGLIEAMQEAKFFDSTDDMLQHICDQSYFHIEPCDLLCEEYSSNPDNRIGWNTTSIITFKSYEEVKNKESYLQYTGGKIYNHPCVVFGFFTDDYEDNWCDIYEDFIRAV